MNKKIFVFAGIAAALLLFIKAKADAWGKVELSFKKFRLTGFSGLDLDGIITVNIKNPTATALSLDALEGTVYENDVRISSFSNQVGAAINPKSTTSLDITIQINILKLGKSVIDLIVSGFKTKFLIDSIATVGSIKIPVRQLFDIDFSQITGQIIKNTTTGSEAAEFNIPADKKTSTPTLIQPELFTRSDNSGFIAANALGEIDPTGGVVITLLPPPGMEYSAFQNIPHEGGSLMVLPTGTPIHNFNPGTGFTIGKVRKQMHPYIASKIVPRSTGEIVVHKQNFNTSDIIEVIKKALPMSVTQTRDLALHLKGRDLKTTLHNIFRFLKTIRYQVDPDNVQIVPLPSKILTDNRTDCKGLAIITHGILTNLGIAHSIRFARYSNSPSPKEFSHVYVIIPMGEKYIAMDAVNSALGMEYTGWSDRPMDLKFTSTGAIGNIFKDAWDSATDKVDQVVDWAAEQRKKAEEEAKRLRDKALEEAKRTQDQIKAKLSQFQDYAKEQGPKIASALKEIWRVSFAITYAIVARNAYLMLLRINFMGWASLWNYGRISDQEAAEQNLSTDFRETAKQAYESLRDKWHNWGGDKAKLAEAIEQGAKKKPIWDKKGNAEIGRIGEGLTIGSAVTAAITIITAVVGIVKMMRGAKGAPADSKIHSGFSDLPLGEESQTFMDKIKPYAPYGIGLAAVGLIWYAVKG